MGTNVGAALPLAGLIGVKTILSYDTFSGDDCFEGPDFSLRRSDNNLSFSSWERLCFIFGSTVKIDGKIPLWLLSELQKTLSLFVALSKLSLEGTMF